MQTTTESANRGFYVGLAIGQLWLSVISTTFVSILWSFGQNAMQIILILLGVAIPGLALVGTSIFLLRSANHLPKETSPEAVARSRAIGQQFGRRFGLVVLAEVVIIGAINFALTQTHHGEWTIPVTFFIVGLHFIPLAFVFHVRAYIVMGILWVLAILLTIIFTRASMILGQGITAWGLFSMVGCGFATWIVTAYILVANINRIRLVSGQLAENVA